MGLPKVIKRVAKFDLYKKGKKIENEKNKSGYTHTFKLPEDENDFILIPKGSVYYEWHRKNSPVQRSLTYPEFPKLKSEYDTNLEDYKDRMDNLNNEFDEDEKYQLLNDIEEFKLELESKLSNIPEQLQESSILNERIEELDSLYDEVENIEE
jgi:phosphoglycerate-specific signal transduction histidine kinase